MLDNIGAEIVDSLIILCFLGYAILLAVILTVFLLFVLGLVFGILLSFF